MRSVVQVHLGPPKPTQVTGLRTLKSDRSVTPAATLVAWTLLYSYGAGELPSVGLSADFRAPRQVRGTVGSHSASATRASAISAGRCLVSRRVARRATWLPADRIRAGQRSIAAVPLVPSATPRLLACAAESTDRRVGFELLRARTRVPCSGGSGAWFSALLPVSLAQFRP